MTRDSLLVPRSNGNPLDPALNPSRISRTEVWFKAAVFALLVLNTAIYLAAGTISEGLDSIAWLTLLALFELETGFARALRGARAVAVVHAIRLVCAAAIGIAAVGYLYDEDWLDAVNTGLWIGVVVLLEFEVRRPAAVATQRRRFNAATAALYAGLLVVALVWLWRGEWFDAYDAALWLVAFATIEMNVLRAGAPA